MEVNEFIIMLNSTLYDSNVFPLICKLDNSAPITKDDLQISDYYLQLLRSDEIHLEDFNVNNFNENLTKIFKSKVDILIKIRSVLMVFALEKIINIREVYGFVITENILHKNKYYEDEGLESVFGPGKYFNEIFFNELSRHPILMADVVETIEIFCKESSQYRESYKIIKEMIIANENSLTPIIPSKFDFMTENLVGFYRNEIFRQSPIILPFQMKFKDYEEWYKKIYFPKIKNNYQVKVERDKVLETVWSLGSLKSYEENFIVDFTEKDKKVVNKDDIEKKREEFIQMAFEEIFDPKNNFFILRKDCYWFKPNTSIPNQEDRIELLNKYRCIGILLGIAISYRIKIPYHLAPYFYKKLLHRDLTHVDLKTFDPENYIKMIRDLENNKIKHYVYEDPMSLEMIDLVNKTIIDENDEDYKLVDLDESNKNTYLDDVAKWVFVDSIQDEFDAFEEGFKKLRRDPYFYKCFRLDELDRIVSGKEERNWVELINNVKYVNCSVDSQNVIWFWDYFNKLDDVNKNNVLMKIRGCNSVPSGGLKNVNIIINSVGSDQKLKCYINEEKIDIPEYDSFDKLNDLCNFIFGIS